MDNLLTVIFIVVFVIVSLRQNSKNKRQQSERTMQQDTLEDNAPQSQEEARGWSVPSAEQIAKRNEELRRKHEELLVEFNKPASEQSTLTQTHKAAVSKVNSAQKTRAPRHKGGSKVATQHASKAPTTPQPSTTTNNHSQGERAFEFDMERAVIESEILRPKYLDY